MSKESVKGIIAAQREELKAFEKALSALDESIHKLDTAARDAVQALSDAERHGMSRTAILKDLGASPLARELLKVAQKRIPHEPTVNTESDTHTEMTEESFPEVSEQQ